MKLISSIQLDRSGTLKGLHTAIDAVLKAGAKGILILMASEQKLDTEKLPALFTSLPVPAFAAIFPGIIHNYSHYHTGSLVCGFINWSSPAIIQNITRPYPQVTREIKEHFGETIPTGAYVFADGHSRGIDNLVACLYDCLGPSPNVIGGGTGYLDFSHRPSVITAEGCFQDAALLLTTSIPLTIGVRHGWKSIAGPFLVTAVEDNIIQSINYEPAFPFYAKIIREHCSTEPDFNDFFEVTKSYPLGMMQLDSEFLVRDPMSRNGDHLECAGNIPLNSLIYILHSQPEALIEATAQLSRDIKGSLSPVYMENRGYYTFTIDCISRALFLDKQYPKELQSIKNEMPENSETIGALSLGEIASSSQGVIQLLNKTTVIGGARC